MRTRRTTLLSADRETQRAQQRTTQCCLPHQKRASMSRSTMWASASVPPDLACPELSLKNGALSWRDRQTAKFAARSSGPRKSASHSGPPPGWLWALPKQPQGWQHARERRPLLQSHAILDAATFSSPFSAGHLAPAGASPLGPPFQGHAQRGNFGACSRAPPGTGALCMHGRCGLLCCASPVACAASPPQCQHTPSSLLPQAPVPRRQVSRR